VSEGGVALCWSPIGIVPLDQQPPFGAEDDFVPAAVNHAPPAQLALPQVVAPAKSAIVPAAAAKASSADPTKPITGAALVRQAKARVREIDRIQRAAKALTPERESLERLIAAATTKPRATPRVVNLKRD